MSFKFPDSIVKLNICAFDELAIDLDIALEILCQSYFE